MARPLRIEYPGALYHIMTRGNAKESIYRTEKDRIIFLEILKTTINRYSWKCYAYCLMENHYHLLIETPSGNLSKGMQYLNGVYTQKYNFNNNRVGHVFQGRYKAVLVEKGSYFLEVVRYIFLNPIKTKLVKKPVEWKWSSYRSVLEGASPLNWIAAEDILKEFS